MSVFLRQQKLARGTYLSLVEARYDPKKGNTVQRTAERIGYLEDLKATYVDPIAHFTEIAKERSAESSKRIAEEKRERMPRETTLKNVGYFLPRHVYGEFGFDQLFGAIGHGRRFAFSPEAVFRLSVLSQILDPSSKQAEFRGKGRFFEDFDFSDDQMYDGVKFIGENEETIKEYVSIRTKKIVEIDTSKTYFDGTNVYFEIDRERGELMRGPEKNNRHDPIIGIGLLMDAKGYPINYSIFPGNRSEQPELHKNVDDLKRKSCVVGRTIITADKGLNSGDNMAKAVEKGDGYVIGQKVRGASADTISWVLQDDELSPYEKTYDKGSVSFMSKSETGEYKVAVTSRLNGQKAEIVLRQKRVVFWSRDYAEKARFERGKVIERAKAIVANPSSYMRSTVGDAAAYVKSISYDANGEIASTELSLDEEAIKEAEKLDGYYMIVSSECDLPDSEIIEIYRGLWEIEETFSIVKGVLKVRPVFAKSEKGVHAHILICFVALLILRILQKDVLLKRLSKEQVEAIQKANKKKRKHKIKYRKVVEYPVRQICSFIRDYNVMSIGGDLYYPTKYNDLIPFIEERFSVILDRKILTAAEIKNIFEAKPQHTTKILD